MSAVPEMRRGWCPDMLRPMETADGLLVRIHPRSGILSAEQARAIAESARLFGNGLLDLSSRGNIQIRGLTAATHPRLVDYLLAAGLLEGVRSQSPFRLTTISPLAGIDPSELINSLTLAEHIDEMGRMIKGLHPKLSLVIDGGGAIPLDGIDADIGLAALDADRLALRLGRRDGNAWVGTLVLATAQEAIARIFSLVSESGACAGLRLREIGDDQLGEVVQILPLNAAEAMPRRPHAAHAGWVSNNGNESFFLVPPYGRCDSEALANAASWSKEFGRGEIRLSPFRALAIPFLAASGEARLTQLASDAGFIVNKDDPRLAVSTCAGMAGCVRGSTATHTDADRIAAALADLPAGTSVHVAGCTKGCAHPAPADLTLVADEGAYQVVLGGTARHKPVSRAGIDAIVERLTTCSSRTDLMRTFGTLRP
jgi:precorrin-3B synthase